MTRLSRRTFVQLALGSIAAAGLTACAPSPNQQSIKFHLSKPEAIPYFRELIEQYHASQDRVRVVFDTSSNLQAGFLRGNPPDLGLLNYNMEMARFMERGALSDLSDMPEAGRILPEVQALVDQYASYPGRTSVLPYSVMAASVIYNKDLFKEHDQAIPTTWEELIKVCDAFKAAGVMPFVATFKEPWSVGQGWWDYSVGGMVDVADFFTRLRKQGTDVGPDSPVSFQRTTLEPTTKMQQLAQAYTAPEAAGMGYGDGNLAFAQGKGAMYLQGPWALGEIAKTSPDLPCGTFPLPMTGDAADLRVRVNIDLAAWIPEDSKNKEAARDFLTFLFRPEVMNAYNAALLGYGTTVDAAPVTDPRIIGMRDFFERAAFYQGPSKAIPLTIPADNYFQGIVLGADPKTTLATLDADWARVAQRQ